MDTGQLSYINNKKNLNKKYVKRHVHSVKENNE